MSNNLEVLAKNRDALLLAEVAAWLHMFGKFHEEFLKGVHGIDIKIPGDVPAGLAQLLEDKTWTGERWNEFLVKNFNAKELSISALIKRHRPLKPGSEGLIQLMADAHGRGSGIEKGILERFAPSQQINVYLSTSLGYEGSNSINLADIQADRQILYKFLQSELEKLKAKHVRLDYDEWLGFRSNFICRLLQDYRKTVAETRRPLNDVTMLDQTAISVAFFKAAMAQNLLLKKWKDPSLSDISDKYRWRLLRVGLDGLSFWGKSVRIGDMLSRKGLIKSVLDEIQVLFEVDYPLGLEIYRDENSSIFVVPAIDDLLSYSDGTQSLEKQIQAIAAKGFSGETLLDVFLSDETRDALLFGKVATRALPQPAPMVGWLKQQWLGQAKEACSVCGLRPQGPGQKALSRKICNVCQDRRVNRSERWSADPSTTIWIDEVADRTGKLVLVVAQFDMVNWLSGRAFNTVLAFDPQKHSLTDRDQKPPSPQVYDFDLPTLISDAQNGLVPGQIFKDNLLGRLVLEDKRGGPDVLDFYDLHVTHTDLGASTSEHKPELLALAMIRQPPSFTRIHRTWETTKRFWEDIEAGLKSNLQEVTGRLRIRGNFIPTVTNRDTLGISHAYEMRLDNVGLSIVCVSEREFLTIDNLQRVAILLNAPDEYRENYAAAMDYVGSRLRERESVEVEEPTGYGSPNTGLGRIQIDTVTLENLPYMPAISILTEPRTFMALAPADKAFHVIEAIKEKYEQEMSKVRNRLSLTVGVVFSGSRTPLHAMLETGRRMLRQPTSGECWQIKSINRIPVPLKSDVYSRVELVLEKDGKLLSLDVKTVMGDGETEDRWYPYWSVESDKDNLKPQGRRRQFMSVDGKDWVHVCDLREGDKVYLTPSRFDFEFMDAAGRRFEVSYESNKRQGDIHPARPYYLEELEAFKELWGILDDGLVTSQIHNLVSLIEEKRLQWSIGSDSETFKRIVSDILENAGWIHHPGEEEFKRLIQAALSGQLKDIVELYSFLDEQSKSER